MELKELSEYEEVEKEMATELIRFSHEKETHSMLDFYPEYDWLMSEVHVSDILPRFDLLSATEPVPLKVPLSFSARYRHH
jgi:hypothetical protein